MNAPRNELDVNLQGNPAIRQQLVMQTDILKNVFGDAMSTNTLLKPQVLNPVVSDLIQTISHSMPHVNDTIESGAIQTPITVGLW